MSSFSDWRLGELWRRTTGMRLDEARIESLRSALHERLATDTAMDTGVAACAIEHTLGKELGELADAVTVRETAFFRHPQQWHALAEYTRNVLIEGCVEPRGRCVRAWSAGCASGEEAYTLAAVLREALPGDWRVQVLGTDISAEAIASSRAGAYTSRALRSAPPQFVDRYFANHGSHFTVRPELRELVEFRWHNLMQPLETDAVFDVVFCRNVLIYLDADAKRTAIAHLRRAMQPSGLLFFGPADALVGADGLAPTRLGDVLAYRASPQQTPKTRGPAAHDPQLLPQRPVRAAARNHRSAAEPDIAELWHQAEQSLSRGERLRAVGLIEAVRERDPNHCDSLIEQVLMLADSGEADHALALCDALVGSGEASADAFAAAGIVVDAAGDPAAAATLLERAGSMDETFAEAHLLRATIAARSGNREAHADALERAARALQIANRPHEDRRLRRFAAGFSAESLRQTVAQQCRDSGVRWERAS